MQQTVSFRLALSWSREICQSLDNTRNVIIWELHFREEDNIKDDNAIQLLFLPKDGIISDISDQWASLADLCKILVTIDKSCNYVIIND